MYHYAFIILVAVTVFLLLSIAALGGLEGLDPGSVSSVGGMNEDKHADEYPNASYSIFVPTFYYLTSCTTP